MGALTESSACELAAAIRDRRVSARDVVEAHIQRHQLLAPRINALAAERFERAREEAAAADRQIAGAGADETLPPLLGVPFTVKESIALRGMPQSTGLTLRRDFRATETAPPVQRLIDAGAIPATMVFWSAPWPCTSAEGLSTRRYSVGNANCAPSSNDTCSVFVARSSRSSVAARIMRPTCAPHPAA